ncbi:L-threonylcarbamoyladenylate synthase [Anaerofustis stercorihominis]|uniref:Threonylcarbamoyl-AMP synthase n=2 Tax=Anaerofustis stercorihominis TaxID=214853 RepID=B1CAL3_9FIRM|nr:L-threonylcarbamoyladenylate synthase [Anaerofustis stercorihominis]EDS72486.1 Sua5/YciO/YrdC/YwlC family protein [Anaerofustis stercorihominis DSM 17244]RGD73571.1 threonylcarbamoyl-AMP synthase [Anaerofustis stercorihominis]
METKIYDLTKDDNLTEIFSDAASVINAGGTVVFPTETVYGLGANAYDDEAVKKIFKAKNRPSDNPLIVHISDLDMIDDLVTCISDDARKLMSKFFPGPLTLIMKKSSKVPNSVSNGLDTVGIRMPSDKEANGFIKACGVPIAAPSANISKRPSITNKKYLVEELSGKVDMILCSKNSSIGLESTVLDVSSDKVKLLRPGKISAEDIEKVIGKKVYGYNGEDALLPKSPGMKYEHYKPKTKVVVLNGNDKSIINYLNDIKADDAGFIGLDNITQKIGNKKIKLKSFGKDISDASRNLYYLLREMDSENLDIIYVQAMDSRGIGLAYMNRLLKAASGDIIHL